MGAWETDDLCYKLFFEGGTQGMLLASTAGALLDANPEACTILGYGREELLGTRLGRLLDSSDPRAKEVLGKRRLQAARKLDLRLLRRNGSPVQAEVSLVQSADGSDDNMLGIMFRQRDEVVTRGRTEDRTHAEGAADGDARPARIPSGVLSESGTSSQADPTFRLLFDTSEAGVLLADSEERITDANTVACHLLQRQRDDLVGSDLGAVFDPSYPFMAVAREAGGENGTFRAAPLMARGDGSLFPAEVRASRREGGDLGVVFRDLTGGGRAEDALEQSQERFEALVENALDLITVCNADNTIRYISPSAKRILGYDPRELVGVFVPSLLHPDDLEPAAQETHTVLSDPESRPPPLRYRHKEGHWVYLENYIKNMLDDPGVQAIIANSRDVTDRVRAEQASKESEERFRALVENAQDLITVCEPDNTIRYVSPAVRRILGYEPEELLGVFVPTLLHPEEIQVAAEAFERSTRTPGSSEPLTLRSRHKDGHWVYMETVFTNLLSDPAVGAMVANSRDVSERVRQQEELRRLNEELRRSVESRSAQLRVAIDEVEDSEEMLRLGEEKWRALIRYASDLTIILDPDGTIRYESPVVERILGFGPQDRVGTNAFDHLHPDDAEPVREKLAEILESPEERISIEYRVRDREGAWHHFEAIGANLLDEPAVGGIVVNTRDITERKLAERRLGAQYAVMRVLQEATTLDEASSRILQTIGESWGWRVGALWEIDHRAGVLRCVRTWNAPSVDAAGFDEVTRQTVFSPGVGLPGRVWASGESAWIPDIAEDANFVRRALADREGLHAAFAFPIMLRHRVLGVMEFFGPEARQPDAALLETMESVGAQIGQFVERKRAEETLRESEEQYRVVAETASDGIIMIDEDSQILFANSSMERIFGYAEEELVGQRLTTLMPEHLRPVHETSLRRYLETGERHLSWNSIELPGLHKSGREIPLEVSFGEFVKGDRRLFTGYMRDITERKRSEEALRQSEKLYRSVIEHAAENIFLVDPKTKRILEANDAFHRSLGYTAEDLSGGIALYDLVAHDPESVDENTRRIMGEGSRFLGERRYRRKDGSLADVEVNVSAVPYGGEEVMCVVAHDVTARRAAEKDLRRSLEVMLALREAGQLLGSTLESEEVVARLLEIMRRVSDLTTAVVSVAHEDGGTRLWRSVGLDNLWPRARFAPEAEAARRAVLENETQQLFRIRRPGSDGEELTGLHLPLRARDRVLGVLEAYGPEAQIDYETIEIVGSLTSQAASALENALLYQDLAERERRLQHLLGQLIQTQEEERRRVAYEVHDGLAQVATAAHLRLQTYARRYPPNTEKAERDLARIVGLVHQTVGEARRIIGNLRPTTLDDFGLAAAVGQVVDGLRGEDWSVSYEENLGNARLPGAVETALFRVAQEALTNARKHAGVREARVELFRENGSVRLRVKDEGRGFDPERLLKAGPGERVGLAGMQERIALLGGSFELWSRPGEGTAVTVEVPLRSIEKEDGSSGE